MGGVVSSTVLAVMAVAAIYALVGSDDITF